MVSLMADQKVKGIVWDSPLLVETGLDRECDVLVYVGSTDETRMKPPAKKPQVAGGRSRPAGKDGRFHWTRRQS